MCEKGNFFLVFRILTNSLKADNLLGTAGLVLAARLSEDPSKSVLVLEAGSAHFDDPLIGKSSPPQ